MIRSRAVIDQMVLYKPGQSLSDALRQTGRDTMVKMASNESLWGPSPRVIRVLNEALTSIQYYPQVQDEVLVERLSLREGVGPRDIILGNGADQILRIVALTFVERGQEVIFPEPSFSAYDHATLLAGATPIAVPLSDDGSNDLAGILDKISPKTRLIYLCAPNNPTGSMIKREDWEYFIHQVPDHVLTVVDGAYMEFVAPEIRPDVVQAIRDGQSVVLVGTFSKLYALAGLRIGWACGPEPLIASMMKTREPFSLNSLAAAGAVAALDDVSYYKRVRDETIASRVHFQRYLLQRGLKYFDSQTNFVTLSVKNSQEVAENLLARGFVVRPTEGFHLPGHLRVTMAPEDTMAEFMAALDEILD